MSTISVAKAVKSAESYCYKLFDDARDLRLEEVDIRANRRRWHITLSFTLSERDDSTRHYKLFVISAGDGAPIAMKMRHKI